MPVGRAFASPEIVHKIRRVNRLRGGRDRQANKMTLGDAMRLDIETRQPESAADHVGTGRQPTPGSPGYQRPVIDKNGRGNTERNDVCERIEFNSELARRPRESRCVTIYAIKEVREDNEKRRLLIITVESRDDREETAHQIAGRK